MISEKILNDPVYIKFINEKYNIDKIIEILKNNNGVSINKLANCFNINEKYIEIYMIIIRDHWCTFFSFGRFFDYRNKWYYIKNDHPYSRLHPFRLQLEYFV